MAMVSTAFSLPTLSPPNLRRVNRYYSGVAYASVSKEATGVRVTEGEGKLPKVVLNSAGGSEADVYLFGGCVTSWKVANGKDLLFVRPDAVFNKKKPISGGLPHCFPQFGPGPIQQHGFARNVDWSIVDSENVEGNPVITLLLKDGPYSRSIWDFSFQALYKVILTTKSLSTELTITNTDNKPFSFSTCLAYILPRFCDRGINPKNPLEGKEERDSVTFPGFVDCVYLNAPNELQFDNGLGDTISIRNTNWTDAVLWNPYLQMEACYRDFVCVENAKIGNVQLGPKQSWTATQHLSID
ncbi:hypothetical protein SLA2020_452980 [Shorea laevis]